VDFLIKEITMSKEVLHFLEVSKLNTFFDNS